MSMRTPLEVVGEIAHGTPSEPLMHDERVAWIRASDLVVGCVQSDIQSWKAGVQAAYEALDSVAPEKRVAPDERWSIVLYVLLGAEPSQESMSVAREIEANVSGTRKVACWLNAIPAGPFIAPTAALPAESEAACNDDPVNAGLDQVASGPLRAALDVLLSKRRRPDEVERLLRLLAEEP